MTSSIIFWLEKIEKDTKREFLPPTEEEWKELLDLEPGKISDSYEIYVELMRKKWEGLEEYKKGIDLTLQSKPIQYETEEELEQIKKEIEALPNFYKHFPEKMTKPVANLRDPNFDGRTFNVKPLTPEEKAKEIYDRHFLLLKPDVDEKYLQKDLAKHSALITVSYMLASNQEHYFQHYWNSVKQALEKRP